MDGVLFDSMPHHAQAWEEVMSRYGLRFTARDCYLQEGRTGQSVIDECFLRERGRHATEDEWTAIYAEKSARFHELGGAAPVEGVQQLLSFLHQQGALIFIVTGSGQQTLFDTLQTHFPGIFTRERMVTAHDVTHGKPDPEPYLKAYERAKAMFLTGPVSQAHSPQADMLTPEQCCVIENAPLGIKAGHDAGFDVFAVNTGPLDDADLWAQHPTKVFRNMHELLLFLKEIPV